MGARGPKSKVKDETLTVAARSNGHQHFANAESEDPEQEERFLTDVLAGYTFWNKQPGNRAKAYAAAYRTLINEFTAEETKE